MTTFKIHKVTNKLSGDSGVWGKTYANGYQISYKTPSMKRVKRIKSVFESVEMAEWAIDSLKSQAAYQ